MMSALSVHSTSIDRPSSKQGLICPACQQGGAKPYLSAPDRFHGRSHWYELVGCSSCGLVWLDNPPVPSEMRQHYGTDYDRSISGGGEEPDHWKERRATILRHHPAGGSVLDLGCSSGGFLNSLKGPSW